LDDHTLVSVSEDKTLRIWRPRNDTLREFFCSCSFELKAKGARVAFDETEGHLVVGLDNGLLLFLEISDDRSSVRLLQQLDMHKGKITAIVCLPEAIITASKDKCVKFYDKASRLIRGGPLGKAAIQSCRYDSASKRLFVGTMERAVQVYRLAEPATGELELVGMLGQTAGTGHSASVRTFDYDEKRKYLFSGGYDKAVCIWSTVPGQERSSRLVGRLQGHSSKLKGLAWDAESKVLFSTGDDKNVCAWDVATGRCVATWQAGESWVLGCRLVAGAPLLVTWGRDKMIKLWSVKTQMI
jgi:WD40 repeat protein